MSANDTQKQGSRTLLASLLMSAPGPIITAIAAITSPSATQIADCIRRTSELIASIVSFITHGRIQRHGAEDAARKAQMERTASRTVAFAMLLSGVALAVVGIYSLIRYTPGAGGVLGLVIAGLGLVANIIFWRRYRRLAREAQDAVLAAQQRLYRAKAVVDFCVVIALSMVAIAPTHPATRYIDAGGSLIVSIYLFYSGIKLLREVPHVNR